MSTVADRTRAAMDAVTSQVDSAPPLALPPPLAWTPPGSRRRWRAPGPRRRRGPWLAPLAAAAAVIAVAISLVVVRGTPNAQPAPAVSPAGEPVSFPDYYLTFNQPVSDETVPVGLELRSTLSGKTLSTLQPPRGLSFAGITGAADDRTFVADAHRDPYGAFNSGGRSRTWYLVRVTGTGSHARLTMTKLPVPATPVGTEILAIALSPDGTKLAVGTAPWTANTTNARQALTVYSVATGVVLRTWTTPPGPANWAIMSGGEGGADPNTGVAWVGNYALAFGGGTQTGHGPAYTIRALGISGPDGDLLSTSRPTTSVPTAFGGSDRKTPFGCDPSWRANVLITGDGTSFVCGGYGTSSARLPESLCKPGVAWNTVAFAGFSLTTGKETFLSGYRTTCQGLAVVAYAVWVNATGSEVIGWMHVANSIPGRFGVFSNGSFRPLPIPVPGNWYQWDDGSLLDQVAW
ncbi:MAG TPA: hypothetical protein VMC83_09420 [Streptosporangiaceae bacterium]|nr:hypothetical protein [Streptosporangiaceae bacterium]